VCVRGSSQIPRRSFFLSYNRPSYINTQPSFTPSFHADGLRAYTLFISTLTQKVLPARENRVCQSEMRIQVDNVFFGNLDSISVRGTSGLRKITACARVAYDLVDFLLWK
jgi:hypothetical protein